MAYKPSKLTLREAIDLIKELGGAENPEDELKRAGECGDITATGLIVTVMGGVPWPEINERIPPRFWRYTIYWDENLILQSPYGTVHLNESEEARKIRIERSGIEIIWGGSNRKDEPQKAATSAPVPKRRKKRPGRKPGHWRREAKKFLRSTVERIGVEYLDRPIGEVGKDVKNHIQRRHTFAYIRDTLPKNRQNIEIGCKNIIEEIKREPPENE